MTAAERRKEATKSRITEAARRLFSEKGYYGTQVMDVVTSINMSAGTFYNYFADKKELFEHVTQENIQNLRSEMKYIRAPLNIWDREDRSTTFTDSIIALFNYVDAHPQEMQMILQGKLVLDNTNAYSFGSEIADDFANDVHTWMKIGVVENINPRIFADAVVGISLQIIHGYLIETRYTREEAVQSIVTMALSLFDNFLTDKGRKLLRLVD